MGRELRATFDPAFIRDVSVKVYRARLCDESGAGADERMLAEDGDGGTKLRNRAAPYDPLTRCYLAALGFEPPEAGDRLFRFNQQALNGEFA